MTMMIAISQLFASIKFDFTFVCVIDDIFIAIELKLLQNALLSKVYTLGRVAAIIYSFFFFYFFSLVHSFKNRIHTTNSMK